MRLPKRPHEKERVQSADVAAPVGSVLLSNPHQTSRLLGSVGGFVVDSIRHQTIFSPFENAGFDVTQPNYDKNTLKTQTKSDTKQSLTTLMRKKADNFDGSQQREQKSACATLL